MLYTTLYVCALQSLSYSCSSKIAKTLLNSPSTLYIHVRPPNNWVNYSFKPQKYNIQYHIHININYIRCLCFGKWLKWIVIVLPQHPIRSQLSWICACKICWWNLAEIIWWRKNCFYSIRFVFRSSLGFLCLVNKFMLCRERRNWNYNFIDRTKIMTVKFEF